MATVSHEMFEDGTVRIKITLSNPEDNTYVEPSTVKLVVRKPSGAETEYTGLTHTPATGLYTKDVTPAAGEAGRWTYRVETTGPAGVAKGAFLVKSKDLA